MREYIKKNKEKLNDKYKVTLKQKKDIVYKHYGNICACCSESNLFFLSIDHINNDGYENKKKGINFYYWIIKNDFPKDLQILCMNCNTGKARNNGVCPHKTECLD